MDDPQWDLGRRIRAARKKQGITLKQLAEQTGLSASFISEVERGISQPSMGSLRKIVQTRVMGPAPGRSLRPCHRP